MDKLITKIKENQAVLLAFKEKLANKKVRAETEVAKIDESIKHVDYLIEISNTTDGENQ